MNRALLVLIFTVFTVFSLYVCWKEGYFGFLDVHRASLWSLQIVLDLVIALTLFMTWMVGDARSRRIPWLPYVVACLALGSIGAMAYLLHRTFFAAPLEASAARS